MKYIEIKCLLLAFGFGLVATSQASNVLRDNGFESGFSGTFGVDGIGEEPTGALYWGVFNQQEGDATASLVTPPPGLPGGAGNYSMLMTESAAGNFLYQTLGDPPDIPQDVYGVGAWVYVLSGSVGIGLADTAGNFHVLASSGVTSGWTYISADFSVKDSFFFGIVSLSRNTEYYVDNVAAYDTPTTPEPTSFLPLSLGALCLLRRKRRT